MELIYILKDKFNQNIAAFENRETARKMQKEMLVKNIETSIHILAMIKQ